MPHIDLHRVPAIHGSGYPPPFDRAAAGRVVRDVAKAGGLTDFVANHVVVPPGGWSSQRHWHEGEDEVVVILSGEAVLVDDDGRTTLRAGDIATFRKGEANAHHMVNEGDADCVMLAISRPEATPVHYPDIGHRWTPGEGMRAET